jgi:hypothetical protein
MYILINNLRISPKYHTTLNETDVSRIQAKVVKRFTRYSQIYVDGGSEIQTECAVSRFAGLHVGRDADRAGREDDPTG